MAVICESPVRPKLYRYSKIFPVHTLTTSSRLQSNIREGHFSDVWKNNLFYIIYNLLILLFRNVGLNID